MNHNDFGHRHLMIKLPILNEQSCYTSSCHAHRPTERVLGALILKIPLEELDAAVATTSREYFLLAIFSTMVLTGTLIVFTRQRIMKPLNALVKASLAVAAGDKTTRLEIRSGQLDDMKVVSQAFNDMLDNLHAATTELENWSQQLEYKVQKKSEELSSAQNELIHIERLASLGKLSSSVAHEINNPLSGILIYTKLIYKQLNNPELYASKRESMLKHLKLIENEAKRCGEIVKGLLEFSREDQADFEPRHLHELLKETYELMSHPVKMANINFYTEFLASDDLVYCSANQVKQACFAMLVNATEAVPENGEIIIRTVNPDQGSIRFDISDNGIGISKENQQHIFEPFFSTKQSTSGIGLGLSIVHGIVQSHKGRIQVFSEPGQGATFSVTIPLIKTQNSES
jgi:two-component system NtrC family sensor kinase